MNTSVSQANVLERLVGATNAHDLDALADCFHVDYDSQFPAHPERAFRGHDQMRRNWSRIFAAVPDLRAVLVSSVSQQDITWAEWDWSGTRPDGLPFAMRGVTIQGVLDGKIAWVRLYMEPVGATAADSDSTLVKVLGE